ncbi:MAG: hypothetical protein M3P27_09735 [Acidobacteriota bacterium]|nr:hypothetical protein [Acidobacteriota bacterium]
MAIAMPAVAGHPNRLPFRGVLTLVDAPSERAPAGARGHRVLLTRAAADHALPSLLGMGLDYTPSLDGHDARRKVGIITAAEIVPSTEYRVPSKNGNSQLATRYSVLEVSGYLFAKDFPDVVRELRAAGNSLGMSYEVADAKVADVSAQIWTLNEVTFTGAAVLKKTKAAYAGTSIELDAGVSSLRFPGSRGRSEMAAQTNATQTNATQKNVAQTNVAQTNKEKK